jgi:hypothetical protein
MRKKTMIVIGILGILLAVGTMSLAMAQNQSGSKTKVIQSHECTPEMMGNMSKNCPGQMMRPGKHGNMMNATNESSMMDKGRAAGNAKITGADHCGSADSDMGSMMDSSVIASKAMM